MTDVNINEIIKWVKSPQLEDSNQKMGFSVLIEMLETLKLDLEFIFNTSETTDNRNLTPEDRLDEILDKVRKMLDIV